MLPRACAKALLSRGAPEAMEAGTEPSGPPGAVELSACSV